jgi:hypothetical protein
MPTNQIEERNNEIISDIQNLQNIETGLFKTLETGLSNNSLASDEQTKLVDQINKVSSMREELFKSLDSTQQYYRDTVSNVGNIIGHQINALDVVENELNESKKRLKIIAEEKNNKLRLVEINTYYGEKYADHAGIMKTVVFFCIPIIILAILANANILPQSIYVFLFIIVVVIAIVVIWRQLIEAYSHDNMNYQEYVWGNSPPEKPYINTSDSNGVDPWKGLGLTCMAQECCDDGYTYVPSPVNKCISNDSLPEGVKPYNEDDQDDSETNSDSQNIDSYNGNSGDFVDSISGFTRDFTGKMSRYTSNTSSNVMQSTRSIYDSLTKL